MIKICRINFKIPETSIFELYLFTGLIIFLNAKIEIWGVFERLNACV